MSEPTRLRDLGGDASDLLRVARRPRAMPAEVRARTAAKIVAVAATPVAIGATAKWLTGKTLAWILGFGALGAAIGVFAFAMHPRTSGVVREDPQVSHAAPAVTIAIPDEPVAIPSTPPSVAPRPVVTPRPSVDTLAEENAILDPARSNADPSAVLAAAENHKKKFPNGQLAADREYLAIRSLAKLGRSADAKTRGESFLVRFPQSPYAMYVRKLIQ